MEEAKDPAGSHPDGARSPARVDGEEGSLGQAHQRDPRSANSSQDDSLLGQAPRRDLRSASSSKTTSSAAANSGSDGKDAKSTSHRAVKAARKARAESLEGILFPFADQKKEFRDLTGEDLKPFRLLENVKFRDLLSEFERAPKAEIRTKLRKLAVSLQSKGRPDPRSRTKGNSKSETKYSQSNKRKERSLSLERGSTSTPAPRSKHLKVGNQSSQVAQAPPPSTPGGAASLVTINEGEEVEIDQLPSEEELASSMESSLSFAEVASGEKKKKWVEYKHLLYVHTGDEERMGMTKATWTLFLEKLTDRTMTLIFEEKAVPNIDWSNFVRGMGILAVADEDSQKLVKELISQIRVAEFLFRGWAKGETGKYIPATAFVPASLKNHTSAKIMQAVVMLNKLPADGYVVRKAKTFKDQGEWRLLRVGVTQDFLEALKKLERVRVGVGCLEFRIHDGSSK